MLGDNAGINDLNQLNILPSSHGSGDLKSPSETAPSKRIPKPRNVFTLSSTAPLLSQENVAKLEQINNAAKQYNIGGNHDQDKSNHVDEGEVVVVVQELDSASSDDSSATSSRTTKLNKNNAHHSSMENLFKPKNHRSSWSGNMSGNTSGGGNARRKRSNCSRSDSDREMVERLTEENMMLIADVEKIRRKKLLFKIAGYFSLAAFRSQRLALEEVRVVKDAKTMGAAARMILHNLLLNSWRNNNKELKSVLEDNAQLNKTLDNLTLQLRVVRHIQTLEKDKLVEKGAEMVRMKAEVKRLEEENETKRNSMDKIENEFNSLQGKVQNLDELNKLYTKDAVVLKETIKALEQSLDSERIKSGTVCRDNANFKQEKRRLQEQLSDVSRQSHHWQERARSFESEAWALKMDLDMKDTQINDVRILHESLRTEKAELASEKEALAAQLKELSDKLDQSDNDREELSKKIGQIKAQVNDQVGRVAELQVSLEATKKQHSTTEKELLKYQVKNAKRRREWANALYFLVNPFDAFRRSLMGPPERVQQFYRNQAPK